jgi:two-component system sensor histidine kinase ChiS
MLGTIGEESRMDGTVVADAVNLASRLQDMTRILGCELIVSGTVVNNLKLPENYHIRRLGSVPLRGKKQQVELFEIYDGNPPQVFRAKRKHHKDFERAVYFISEGRFGEAAELLATIPKEAAEADPGLKYYLNMLHQK